MPQRTEQEREESERQGQEGIDRAATKYIHEALMVLSQHMPSRADLDKAGGGVVLDAWQLVRIAAECFFKRRENGNPLYPSEATEIVTLWEVRRAIGSELLHSEHLDALLRELLIAAYYRAAQKEELKTKPASV